MLKTYIYPYTNQLYEFLIKNNYDERLYFTNQLGSLKNYLYGAHHTRYEYVMLQWTLIHQLKEQKKNSGLSSAKDPFGKIEGFDKFPSGGEILQCLVLLTNMGHLADTFAASRAWLYLLEKNKGKVRAGFKSGLVKEDRVLLDKVIEEFDIYNIHLINALFLLQRYKRIDENNSYIDFGSAIIREYIKRENKSLERLWDMYSIIRKISYLILDSTYAPLPFNLDLYSIISNINDIFDEENGNKKSTLIGAINQIDTVLQESLYMSGNSLLTVSDTSSRILNRFEEIFIGGEKIGKISVIRDLLEPKQDKVNPGDVSSIFDNQNTLYFKQYPWRTDNILELRFSNIKAYAEVFPQNIVEWEKKLTREIGRCHVCAANAVNKEVFHMVYAPCKELNSGKYVIKCLDIAKKALGFINKTNKLGYINLYNNVNYNKIMTFLFRAVFGGDKSYVLDKPYIQQYQGEAVFSDKGSTKLACHIGDYINKAKKSLNTDQIHEISLTQKVVKELSYQGDIITFVGATKIFKRGSSTESAEFDGIIFIPARKSEFFLIIVEAKNKSNGHTEAKKQLKKRLNDLLPSYLEYVIEEKPLEGAIAKIKVKQNCDNGG